jgi:predicted Zn-dependent peptidase
MIRGEICLSAAMLLAAQLASAQVRLPDYSRETLPNGVVLLLMPRAGLPLVHLRVVVKGGAEAEPAQLAGLSSVTAALLRRGTARRNADQFSRELDFLGGVFGVNSDNASTVATAEFLTKDFDSGVDLLADALLHATFPEEETAKEVGRRVDAAKSAKDNAQAAVGSYARAAFFGPDHPYGHLPDQVTLGSIRRDDVVEFYRRLYVGRNMVVAVVGDFDPAAVKRKLAEAFGSAPAGETYAWAVAPSLARKGRVLLIDKPDATQTYFQIVQPGIDRAHADRVKLDLVNALFGGRFTSMLNDELRVNSGLTYGASSSVERSRLTGALTISTYTRTETTVQAIDLALDILERLGEKGISAAQLASTKAYVKGVFPTSRLETIDQLASAVTELELYGLGRDEIDQYYARLDAVTLDEANATARKYYRRDDLLLVMVGAAARIREQVSKYGDVVVAPIQTPGWRVPARP